MTKKVINLFPKQLADTDVMACPSCQSVAFRFYADATVGCDRCAYNVPLITWLAACTARWAGRTLEDNS